MSTFLQRLGTRAIGRAAIVPRAAALFEPPTAAPVAALAPMDAASSAPVRVEPLAGEVSGRYVAAEPPRREMPILGRGKVDEPSLAPPSGTAPRDAQPSLLPGRTSVHEGLLRGADTDPPRAASSIHTPRSESILMAVSIARSAASPPALVATHPLPTPRAMAAGPVTNATPGSATVEALAPVRVTIGRVEVRAVFDQGPSRPAARASAPTPSLDEYLRKRGRS